MQGQGPHEALARDRRRYERLLLARLGGALSKEDAEDIVSEALIRTQLKTASEPPEPGREQAWFARVVLNLGIDFLRARDGRRRNGASPRPTLVPLTHIDEETLGVDREEDEAPEIEELAAQSEREHTKALVERVMAQLDAKDVELIKLRHLVGPSASREQLATMAGLTVGEFRWRYARAWRRFVAAVESDAPSERCRHIRDLLGDVQAGVAPAEASAEIDAHALDCASCKVFAREAYRALELMPYAPVVGFAEQWAQRIAMWWERSGPEASAGAGTAAAGAGIWSLFGGSAAGLFKAVAIVCSATAVTAGVCAGVVAVLDDWPERPRERREQAERAKERTVTPTPTPTFVATPAGTPTPTRTPDAPSKPRAERRGEESPNFDPSGETEIPASAPATSSEFNPASGPSTQPDPAPVPVSGGGEFSP